MAKDTGTAPAPRPAARVRNVALVGHAGAGKTTLAEALLVATGALPRAGRIEDGTTALDTEEVEVRQQRSVSLGVATIEHADHRITLLDTPGSPDFVGELRAGLRAADAALFVVSAVNGVDAATVQLWEECAAVGMPRAVVVTQLDRARADVDDAVRLCQLLLGEGVYPVHLVDRGPDGSVRGLVNLLDPDADAPEADRLRSELIEGIIGESEDEALMERYLAGDQLVQADLIADLETAVTRAHFHPVLCAAPLTGVGIPDLLELIVSGFPCPMEHGCPPVSRPEGGAAPSLECDPDGPLVAEVVKTTTDPYVGRVSLVRVFSGTLSPDTTVHVSGHFSDFFGTDRGHQDHDVDEKVGAITSPLGKTQRPVPKAIAGDICAVAKLTRAETGDTLSGKDDPLLMEPWVMPDPLLPVAVVARSKADEDKLSQGLGRLVAEDPTLRLENNPETHQLVLWCMGEAHLDVLLDRLKNRYGVEVETVPLRVQLRETFAGKATAKGRHVKQSGGHGQYAICDIEVEPLESGQGFEFVDKVVGGAVPRQFIPSVEKGVRTQMERGVAAGYPVVDIRVTLVDGKAHSVDSSDMAFQTAGALALKEAAAAGQVDLLEPVDELGVLVPEEYVGAVMSDLSGRRGRVLGTEAVAGGRTLVRADVPQVELPRYAVDLRSMSHGTGTFTREFRRYEPMPSHVAAKVREQEAA